MAKKKVSKKKVTKKTVAKQVAKPTFPKFVFVGASGRCPDNPASTTFGGLTFELNGKPVEVDDPYVVFKLQTNSHFKEV